MKIFFAIILLLVTLVAVPASAHQLDEYLQASTIALAKDHVFIRMRLTPGVAVADGVIASIDSDRNGILTDAEQRSYAERVVRDLSLKIDGQRARLEIVSLAFPSIDDMKQGLGDILLNLRAEIPAGGASRTIAFENHHNSAIAAYLVNCLVPNDSSLHVGAQNRNYDQSIYEVSFTSGDATGMPAPAQASTGVRRWWNQSDDLSVLKTYFVHGVHHILTGYDHLLFVSALVLGAATLWDLVKVVTAFTLAHSITLTLASLNLVHLSSRVVEPLIAASIVFVAMQNIFWPGQARGISRLMVAFFFGLFHGLGFAGGLLDLMHQMPGSTILLAILGFSIGVEAGHQIVLLPLFGLLKAIRQTQASAVPHVRLAMAVQRIGSTGISIAGMYYLSVALLGHS